MAKNQRSPILTLVLAVALASSALACARDVSGQSAVGEADVTFSAEPETQAERSVADWTTELQVKMALLENLGTDGLKVEVACREGAVSLSGLVGKPETKELAETMAESVPSVAVVRNEIDLASSLDEPGEATPVGGETDLRDAVLSTRVRLALVEALGTSGFRVGSEVARGRVTLQFSPDFSPAQRADALKAVRDVEGVAEVVSVDQA